MSYVDSICADLYADIGKVVVKRGERVEVEKGKSEVDSLRKIAEIIEQTVLVIGPLLETIEIVERLGARWRLNEGGEVACCCE